MAAVSCSPKDAQAIIDEMVGDAAKILTENAARVNVKARL